MDIIVTTPKSEMRNAAKEAADAIAAGGGEYFRRFSLHHYPGLLNVGDRVYYVEDGYVRGFALVREIVKRDTSMRCDTTGIVWPPGVYVFMRADSWQWIKPIPMKGFQGFCYAVKQPLFDCKDGKATQYDALMAGNKIIGKIEITGGWRDKKLCVTNMDLCTQFATNGVRK